MFNRELVVPEARKWLGVKFRKGGRDMTGIDCIGLLVKIGEALGIKIEDTLEYTFNPEPVIFTDFVYRQSEPRPMTDLQVGSILIFKQSIFPMHCGILARDHHKQWSVINANIKERAVVEQPLHMWRKDLINVRDYKGT